jgi:hypothetical protein
MQAEDDAKAGIKNSVQKQESENAKDAQQPPLLQSENESSMLAPSIKVNVQETNPTSEQNDGNKAAGTLAIVPSKKQGGFDFLRKLLLRRKKGRNKRTKLIANA